MIELLVFLVVLMGAWLVWSGVFAPLLITLGGLSVLGTVWLVTRMEATDSEHYHIHLNWRTPLYGLWLVKEIFFSSIAVARVVWARKINITPDMGWVHSSQKTNEARVFYANSITLTPGTVACDVEGQKILVHALEKDGLTSLKEGVMDRKVTRSYE